MLIFQRSALGVFYRSELGQRNILMDEEEPLGHCCTPGPNGFSYGRFSASCSEVTETECIEGGGFFYEESEECIRTCNSRIGPYEPGTPCLQITSHVLNATFIHDRFDGQFLADDSIQDSTSNEGSTSEQAMGSRTEDRGLDTECTAFTTISGSVDIPRMIDLSESSTYDVSFSWSLTCEDEGECPLTNKINGETALEFCNRPSSPLRYTRGGGAGITLQTGQDVGYDTFNMDDSGVLMSSAVATTTFFFPDRFGVGSATVEGSFESANILFLWGYVFCDDADPDQIPVPDDSDPSDPSNESNPSDPSDTSEPSDPSDISNSNPSNPEPSNPEPSNPSNPEPSNPEPSNPEPSNPEPSNPEPSNPEPSNPEPSNPSNPEPSNPEPSDPSNPEPSDPEPSDPSDPMVYVCMGEGCFPRLTSELSDDQVGYDSEEICMESCGPRWECQDGGGCLRHSNPSTVPEGKIAHRTSDDCESFCFDTPDDASCCKILERVSINDGADFTDGNVAVRPQANAFDVGRMKLEVDAPETIPEDNDDLVLQVNWELLLNPDAALPIGNDDEPNPLILDIRYRIANGALQQIYRGPDLSGSSPITIPSGCGRLVRVFFDFNTTDLDPSLSYQVEYGDAGNFNNCLTGVFTGDAGDPE